MKVNVHAVSFNSMPEAARQRNGTQMTSRSHYLGARFQFTFARLVATMASTAAEHEDV